MYTLKIFLLSKFVLANSDFSSTDISGWIINKGVFNDVT